MHSFTSHHYPDLRARITQAFRDHARPVANNRWQARDVSKDPSLQMRELQHVSVELLEIPRNKGELQKQVFDCNLPWAEDHFEERVCGQPINPGEQWAKWPWGHSASTFLDETGKFNHNYMERYWPKFAGRVTNPTQHPDDYPRLHPVDTRWGIRYPYGDLGDVVTQLVRDPLTRQAVLPVFFPEDTGAVHGDRIPCSIFYQFMLRGSQLHCSYYLRSCELVRHFPDDLYLAARLTQWVIDQASHQDARWHRIKPGSLWINIGSFHCFENDYLQMMSQP